MFEQLRELLGDRFRTTRAEREQHGKDESYHEPHLPDAVAHVRTTEEVSLVLATCHTVGMPVVPFGAGTSLEGGVTALHGGISLDLGSMTKILELSPDDLHAKVEAGVTHGMLNAVARPRGVFFSVDPGADATLGGMCATRASGTTAVRYGTMRNNVLGLTAVLADGTVISTGGRARKSSAGYDLTGLLVGSEGTLAVITEVIVRLHPTPETIHAGTCSFPDLDSAVGAVVSVLGSGVVPARIELLDEVMVSAVMAYSGIPLPEGPALFFEFHGGPAHVTEQVSVVQEIVADFGASPLEQATDEKSRRALWQARHDALPAAKALRPGSSTWSTDVCVPVSRLVESIHATKSDIARSGLLAPIAGHVGDGNFHLAFVVDPSDADELASAREVNDAMVSRALAIGGTCSGEHGIGLGKLDHLRAEAGPALGAMREIKRALDPRGILNPGKVIG
ncbi:MAG TPA: FAD-linked oxidase C-terminal domain-containing protein [Intrasporangium sp.]|nr:FAD-linked oxidase C-terminal domain-containing protein [Intrasporangium sp.]